MSEMHRMPSLHPPRPRRIAVLAAFALLSTVAYADDTLVDPTRPATAGPQAHRTGEVRVQAILDRDGHRVAIVAGEIVRAGDRRPWGEVEEVTKTGIRYVFAGRTRFAALEITKLQVRRVSAGPGGAP